MAPGTRASLTSAGLSTKSWALALTQTCSRLLLQVAQLSGAHIQAAESLGQGHGFPKPHRPQRWPLRASGPGHVLQGSKCHHPATGDGPRAPQGESVHVPSARGLGTEERGLEITQGETRCAHRERGTSAGAYAPGREA